MGPPEGPKRQRQVGLDVTQIAVGAAAAVLQALMQGKGSEAVSQALGEMAAEIHRFSAIC